MSLRGDDLDFDYAALVDDVHARRVNFMNPESSLLLQKAVQDVAHEGGKRFDKNSWEYQTLMKWIAQGAPSSTDEEIHLTKLEVTPAQLTLSLPQDEIQIKAIATFSDGSTKDVTPYAVYEEAQNGLVKVSTAGKVKSLKAGEPTIIVRYLNKQQPVTYRFVAARPNFKWEPQYQTNFVDREVFTKLESLKMNPSPVVNDETFLRRLSLDLLGLPPSEAELAEFLANADPSKRDLWVDKLMARPEFADFWTLKWADALRVEARTMDQKGMQLFHQWIRKAVAENRPVNEFVRDILIAQGSTYDVPEANFYRAIRTAESRAQAIAQVFLGTRLQCAQCHNHPFDRWTQDDYFEWAAVFSRIDYDILESKNDANDKHSFKGDQIVKLNKTAKFLNPRTGEQAKPKLLGATSIPEDSLQTEKDLLVTADWLTNPQNTQFATAQVNRIWFHLMGRGIVDPVDDFRASNPPSHPQLLKQLAEEFVTSGYDMRHIIRLITTSKTYQLSSIPNETNQEDTVNYSHNLIRRLSAEQLFDSLHNFFQVDAKFSEFPGVTKAVQLPGPVSSSRAVNSLSPSISFLRQFGQPPRLLACECERTNETTMSQAFALISSPELHKLMTNKGNILTRLIQHKVPVREQIQTLYIRGLSRSVSESELNSLEKYLQSSPDPRVALEDLAWGLINSKEFILRN